MVRTSFAEKKQKKWKKKIRLKQYDSLRSKGRHKLEPYKASFDKYVLEFTSKSFVKKIFEKLILPHVCTKKFDLSDV
jgi:hypothetical protein